MPAVETAQRAGGVARSGRSVAWALLPLLLGIPAGPCFAWAAYRCRSRRLALEAAAYTAATIAFFALATQPELGTVSGLVGIALTVVATTRAFVIGRRVFRLATGAPVAPPLPSGAPVTWQAPARPPRDPDQPATWTTPFDCTGQDRHLLSIPWNRTGSMAAGGAALTALSAWAHVYGRAFGAGIGLMATPLIAALFSRRVDGVTLIYRSWGAPHRLRLDRVTQVTVKTGPHQAIYLRLAAPGLPRPVSVTIRAAGWVAPPAARDHLLGWLEHPGVQMSPEAGELLRSGTLGGTGVHLPKRHRRAWAAVWLLLPIVAVGVAGWRVYDNHRLHAALAVPGSPGYATMTGPAGKPLAAGRPWGRACEPLRVEATASVPGAVYAQLATVVAEARNVGLNLTLESRSYTWDPSTLVLPAGMDPRSVPVVQVDTTTAAAPQLSSGRPERISEGWDARPDPDGRHEDLTFVRGRLYLATLGGNLLAQRTALREIVAFGEGVGHTSNGDSGIRSGSTVDAFTAADVRALQTMSGCG